MPALPFFTALAPAPMAPETSQSGTTKNNLLPPASTMESPSGELSQGEGMMPSMVDTPATGDQESAVSFWQQLQMATALPEGQESSSLPLTELTESLKEVDLNQTSLNEASMSEGSLNMQSLNEGSVNVDSLNELSLSTDEQGFEQSNLIDENPMPILSPLAMAHTAATVSEQATPVKMGFSDLERQRQAQPQLQTNVKQTTLASQQIQANDLSHNTQLANNIQVQGPSIELDTDANSQTLNLASQGQALSNSGNVKSTMQSAAGLTENQAITAEEGLDTGLDLSSLDEMVETNIHEKPITLQPKKTLETPLTTNNAAVMADSLQTQNADPLQGLHSQSTNRTNALDQAQQLNQAKQDISQEKLNTQFKVDVPPQNPQWNDQVAKRIAIMATEQLQTARIQLDPPELGALEIKIRVQNDQVNVAFASNHQVVRDALESQAPRLRELLEQQGVELADVDVSSQNQQQGESGETGADTDSEDSGEQGFVNGDQIADETESVTTLESDSLVDYFA